MTDTTESPGAPDLSALLPTRPSVSSVDFVVSSLKDLLLNRHLQPGDRLPSETELTRLFAVSRGSVREAMKILSALGIVEIRQGDGTYVTRGDNEALFDPLLFKLIVSRPKFAEIKELRLILEKSVARLVIERASDEEISRLRDSFGKMPDGPAQTEIDHERLLLSDLEFHALLGQSCHNAPLETIYRFVMQYFKPCIAESQRKHGNAGRKASEAHRKILQAIERRDESACDQAIENSMAVWEELICRPPR